MKKVARSLKQANGVNAKAALSSVLKSRVARKLSKGVSSGVAAAKNLINDENKNERNGANESEYESGDSELDSDSDSDSDASVDSTTSHSSNMSSASTSSASSAVRLFLNTNVSSELRSDVAGVLRERSEFKTPRDIPIKPHQKPSKVAFKEAQRGQFDSARKPAAPAVPAPAPAPPPALSASDIESIFSKIRHNRYDAIADMLASKSFQVEIKDEFGNTPIILAAQNNNKKLIKLFLKHSGNINAANNLGNTALHYACLLKYDEVGACLRKYGARSDIRNKNGDICYTIG